MNFKLDLGQGQQMVLDQAVWPRTLITMLLLTRASVQVILMKDPSSTAYTRLNGASCNYTLNKIIYAITNTCLHKLTCNELLKLILT